MFDSSSNTIELLNDRPDFGWADLRPEEGSCFAKVSVGSESFWIRDCRVVGPGIYEGKVDNDLLCTEDHGLQLYDIVHFKVDAPPIEGSLPPGNG